MILLFILPPVWLIFPFVLLLALIATGPIFFKHFWHNYYHLISIALGVFVGVYYVFVLNDVHHPVHTLSDYISFIALLTSLFVASGGILIKVHTKNTPMANVIILFIGALISNLIGTTGASMLLIRPFIRLNKDRIRAYHVIFFIFLVSNIGGALTPIGDPPLFLGYLKGVPFLWPLKYLFMEWGIAVFLVLLAFYFIDKRNYSVQTSDDNSSKMKIEITGTKNFFWLGIILFSVFLEPNLFDWVPCFYYDGNKISFLRELIMFVSAFFCYRSSDPRALQGNEFNFDPIKEVAFLFIGIFLTMVPALQLVSEFARVNSEHLHVHSFYWATGILSSILDNAPTYLNFLAAGMGKASLNIDSYRDVLLFSQGKTLVFGENTIEYLTAISVSAVFFGAMTYIGNGPNFMVKSIAEQVGIEMPAFFGYIMKYSLPILIPVFLLIWFIFFGVPHLF